MKSKLMLLIAFTVSTSLHLRAALNIPGADGSDGIFAPDTSQTNVVIDLSQAVTGAWNASNTANAGKGVYDPAKWVVVFKYASVNIPKSVRVNFVNHPSHAPVAWLVSGDVTISGEVSLDAEASLDRRSNENPYYEPGAGGFRGGTAAVGGALTRGDGMGPGGGNVNMNIASAAYGDARDSRTYGNNRIVPLIGGSGAFGGDGFFDPRNGSSGGGAILIAARNLLAIDGSIHAYGTIGPNHRGGSGGAIRLISENLLGTGLIDTRSSPDVFGGSYGRARLEAVNYAGGLTVYPPTLRVLPDAPPTIFPDNLPTARVVSIAGQNAPLDPHSNLTETGTDVAFQTDQPVDIQIETSNLAPTASVTAHIIPRHGDRYVAKAVHVSGDASLSRWVATTNLPPGFAVIQVRAVGQ